MSRHGAAIALVLITSAAACGGADRDAADRVIVPGERVGAITRATGLAQLRQIYGTAYVRSGPVDAGEGETVPGAVVFPDDSAQRLEIVWWDSTARAPRSIAIGGDTSAWHTGDGITIGTPLSRLAALNGRPFILLGFNWDYAGTIVSWDSGGLAVPHGPGRLLIRVQPKGPGAAVDSLMALLAGDREYRSDHAAMRALDPAVYRLVVIFDQADTATSRP